jgi:hypothetical protein
MREDMCLSVEEGGGDRYSPKHTLSTRFDARPHDYGTSSSTRVLLRHPIVKQLNITKTKQAL